MSFVDGYAMGLQLRRQLEAQQLAQVREARVAEFERKQLSLQESAMQANEAARAGTLAQQQGELEEQHRHNVEAETTARLIGGLKGSRGTFRPALDALGNITGLEPVEEVAVTPELKKQFPALQNVESLPKDLFLKMFSTTTPKTVAATRSKPKGQGGPKAATPAQFANLEKWKADRLSDLEQKYTQGKIASPEQLRQLKQMVQDSFEEQNRALGGMPQHFEYPSAGGTQAAPPPAAGPAAPPEELPAPARAVLKEGVLTEFRNGQTWTLSNGQPRRVK